MKKLVFIILKMLSLIALSFLAFILSFQILGTLLSTGDDAQIESPISSVEIVEVSDVEQLTSLQCDKISEKEEFIERIILSGIERVYVSHGDYDIIFMGFNLPEEVALEYAIHIEVGIRKLVKIGNLEVGEGVIKIEYSRAWVGILLFTIISIILWILIIDLFFNLERALESLAVPEMEEVSRAPLKNISFSVLSKMKKVLKSLLGDYTTFSSIIELYKTERRCALLYQMLALTLIIVFYFIFKAYGNFVLRPMLIINAAVCVFLFLNSGWVITELDIKFGKLVDLGVFMTPIIWIFFASTLIFEIIRMQVSLTGWMILIGLLLSLVILLSFCIGLVLAGIAFVCGLPVPRERRNLTVKVNG